LELVTPCPRKWHLPSELVKPNLISSGKINLLNSTSEKSSEPKSTIWTKRITASCVQNTSMIMMMIYDV